MSFLGTRAYLSQKPIRNESVGSLCIFKGKCVTVFMLTQEVQAAESPGAFYSYFMIAAYQSNPESVFYMTVSLKHVLHTALQTLSFCIWPDSMFL